MNDWLFTVSSFSPIRVLECYHVLYTLNPEAIKMFEALLGRSCSSAETKKLQKLMMINAGALSAISIGQKRKATLLFSFLKPTTSLMGTIFSHASSWLLRRKCPHPWSHDSLIILHQVHINDAWQVSHNWQVLGSVNSQCHDIKPFDIIACQLKRHWGIDPTSFLLV